MCIRAITGIEIVHQMILCLNTLFVFSKIRYDIIYSCFGKKLIKIFMEEAVKVSYFLIMT